jgi:hypothetical protein
MKKLILLFALAAAGHIGLAQKIYTKIGKISFFSKTKAEDINAENNQVMSVINIPTGDVQFSLLVKGFHFRKALMEEHFNENYIESNKFPNAKFKGKIENLTKVNFAKDGNYTVSVKGDLELHGVTKNIISPATVLVKGGKISGNCSFKIKPEDYNISIPGAARNSIEEFIKVTIDCNYDQKM